MGYSIVWKNSFFFMSVQGYTLPSWIQLCSYHGLFRPAFIHTPGLVQLTDHMAEECLPRFFRVWHALCIKDPKVSAHSICQSICILMDINLPICRLNNILNAWEKNKINEYSLMPSWTVELKINRKKSCSTARFFLVIYKAFNLNSEKH